MKDNRCITITCLKRNIKYHPCVGTYVSEEDIDLSPRVFCSYDDEKFDFSSCRDGVHKFKTIIEKEYIDEDVTVKWCSQCGAIAKERRIFNMEDSVEPKLSKKIEFPGITEKYGLK